MPALFVVGAPTVADAASRTGTDRSDRIVATQGDDVIRGLGGNDVIFAGKGNDRVDAGPGNDRIEGEDNRDQLNGGPGNDLIDGGDNDDTMLGGPGNDYLQGSSGDDRITGGAGQDTVLGGANTDIYTFQGRFGSDLVLERSGNKDILVFPDLSFAQVRAVKKGQNNVVLITPNGRVEIADQALKRCRKTNRGDSRIEGLVFKDGQAQVEGSTGNTIKLFRVNKINTTDCGGRFEVHLASANGDFTNPEDRNR